MTNAAEEKRRRNGCIAVLGGIVFALALVIWGIGNRTTPPSATDTPKSTLSPQQTVDKVASGIDLLAGGRKVESVTIAGVVLSVEYQTTESEQSKFVDEWIDLFEAVGSSLAVEASPVDRVELRMYSAGGQFVGTVQANLSDIQDRRGGKISEREFIERLVVNDT